MLRSSSVLGSIPSLPMSKGDSCNSMSEGALQLAQVPAFRCLTPREDEGNGGTVQKGDRPAAPKRQQTGRPLWRDGCESRIAG